MGIAENWRGGHGFKFYNVHSENPANWILTHQRTTCVPTHLHFILQNIFIESANNATLSLSQHSTGSGVLNRGGGGGDLPYMLLLLSGERIFLMQDFEVFEDTSAYFRLWTLKGKFQISEFPRPG